jgi:hypothetical protein
LSFVVRPQTAWKQLKQVNVDGVIYDICFSERSGMYQAAWVCRQCCEQGPWAPISSTPSQAGELAHLGLLMHHSITHQTPRKLLRSDTA